MRNIYRSIFNVIMNGRSNFQLLLPFIKFMRFKIGNLSKNSELLILTIVSKESTDHSIPYHVSDGANLIECLQHQMSLLVVEGLSYWSF